MKTLSTWSLNRNGGNADWFMKDAIGPHSLNSSYVAFYQCHIKTLHQMFGILLQALNQEILFFFETGSFYNSF